MSYFGKDWRQHRSISDSPLPSFQELHQSSGSFIHVKPASIHAKHLEMNTEMIQKLLQEQKRTVKKNEEQTPLLDTFPEEIKDEEEMKEMLSYLAGYETLDSEQLYAEAEKISRKRE